jgi:ferredoxin-NADP reductase
MVDPTAPSTWQTATVVSIADETARAKTFTLRLERPTGHRAGQHYVIRLTAPDGYTASRSYSVASAPDGSAELELTVERLEDRGWCP